MVVVGGGGVGSGGEKGRRREKRLARGETTSGRIEGKREDRIPPSLTDLSKGDDGRSSRQEEVRSKLRMAYLVLITMNSNVNTIIYSGAYNYNYNYYEAVTDSQLGGGGYG